METGSDKILVVFYSRTGTTRCLARSMAEKLACPVEELVDLRPRKGLLHFLRAGFDGWFRRTTVLAPLEEDPVDYDLVIIGTPVWSASLSAPVRTYLNHMEGRLPAVAFFLSHGGSGRDRVFRQMADLVGHEPEALLSVNEAEFDDGQWQRKVSAFVDKLRADRLEDEWLTQAVG